jgi:curved DNA-binding protein CbpA
MLVPFEAKAERLLVEVSKFAEIFEATPLSADFDARSAAEFCYEVEVLLQKFRFCDHYAVLDVGRKSSKEQITNAFRELAKKFHPDRHSQLSNYHLDLKTDLKTIFERVAEAYYTLTDYKRRAAYDHTLKPLSTMAKGTGHFVDGKVSAEVGKSLQGTQPLPPVIPGMPGSEEYEVAIEFYRKRYFDKARKMLLEAITADPENPEYQVALARSLLKLPNYIRQAETAYLKAIDLAPRNSEYCAELGLFYQLFSQTAQARTMFKLALELDPSNPIALRVNM